MTLKEHIKTAKALVKIRRDTMAMFCVGPRRFKHITKAEQNRMSRLVWLIDGVKCTLDDVYCRSTDKKTFEKLGFIYYRVTTAGHKNGIKTIA